MPSDFNALLNMPETPVHYRVCYPSWDWQETNFRDQDHLAHFFTWAVKGDQQKIGAKFKMMKVGAGNAEVRIDRNNLDVVQRYFGRFAAAQARAAGIEDPVFVAIPNRNALAEVADFKSAGLARAAAQAFGAGAAAYTGLRFRALVPKAQGVRQRVSDLVENMVMIALPPPGTLVLIDDVYTLGRHITAANQILPRRAALCVVAARTMKEPQEQMTAPGVETHYG